MTPAQLLARLVRFETVNPPGREAGGIGFLREVLEGAGIECRAFALDPDRPNLVARLAGRGAAPPPASMAGASWSSSTRTSSPACVMRSASSAASRPTWRAAGSTPVMVSEKQSCRVIAGVSGPGGHGALPRAGANLNVVPAAAEVEMFMSTIHAADERIPTGEVAWGAELVWQAVRRWRSD